MLKENVEFQWLGDTVTDGGVAMITPAGFELAAIVTGEVGMEVSVTETNSQWFTPQSVMPTIGGYAVHEAAIEAVYWVVIATVTLAVEIPLYTADVDVTSC